MTNYSIVNQNNLIYGNITTVIHECKMITEYANGTPFQMYLDYKGKYQILV